MNIEQRNERAKVFRRWNLLEMYAGNERMSRDLTGIG